VDPVGLARVGAACSCATAGLLVLVAPLTGSSGRALAADGVPIHVELWADRDDDDADGHPDGEQSQLPPVTRGDFVALDKRLVGAKLQVVSGGDHARVVLSQNGVMPWGRVVPEPGWFEGLSPGHVELLAKQAGIQTKVTLDVRGVDMRDGEGKLVDMARSHASLERTPPARIEGPADAPYDDFDALRVVVSIPDDGTTPFGDQEVAIESVSALGVRVDAIGHFALAPTSCPSAYTAVRCFASAPLRFVIDDVDRNHPLVSDRSIKAEVGGAIVVRTGGHKAQMIRVLGPRTSPVGPIARLRATLRPFVVRVTAGGAPAIGGTDVGAVSALRAELGAASAIWGQCGLTFGEPKLLDVKLVDPPPSHLVAIGDDLGISASGGDIRLRVEGKTIAVTVAAGASPDRVAWDVARAAERAGLSAIVSPNARIGPGIAPSVDVSLRRKDGTLVAVDAVPGAPLSTDATLSVRVGSVDLSDGLQHFTDMDAMAGTLEERTLLKALDDGDPQTIEVVVVPLFAGGGRIGESFIGSDLSSVRNVVLLDRAGIRARKSSLTLAHELGHVLMDMPGHPDDYGVDTPTLLMDSDAADASPFGPRRITLDECARVVRQAGPKARVPLLADWPIAALPK
jgi:hypothetical protein